MGVLGFPGGTLEEYAGPLPVVLFGLLGLLLREKAKDEKSKVEGED